MKKTTLCFLHTATDILLALKKVRFGAGKMNGVGGKVNGDETVEEAIIRETQEEIGVSINEESLEKVAILHFTFEDKPEWNQECHVFFTSEWEGEPTESEEMRPEWYSKDAIPYDKMWEDDKHWLPKVLAGERIRFHSTFNKENQLKDDFTIEPLVE
jgi:ADP-ribose pyrophosphatase YjhB (NUDIX family)